eukprot:1087997-Amphidinium_carterae.1
MVALLMWQFCFNLYQQPIHNAPEGGSQARLHDVGGVVLCFGSSVFAAVGMSCHSDSWELSLIHISEPTRPRLI